MKFAAFLFATSIVTILVSSLTVKASDSRPLLERGNRVVASIAAGKGTQKLAVVEHPRDDGNLSLEITAPDGRKLRNDNLISALDRDEDDVTSYNVSAQSDAAGGFVISSVKDWGTANWSYGYTVSFRDGGYHLSRFDYKLESHKKHGTCSLDLASGGAVVNGRSMTFEVPADQIDRVDGIDLERICSQLGMN